MTTALASDFATHMTASQNSGWSSAGSPPAAPFAMKAEISLVLWSPSTLITLKLESMTVCHLAPIGWSNRASVVMKLKVVACSTLMAGEIMPEPLAIPPIVAKVPSFRVIWQATVFILVSVVIIALAAAMLASLPRSSCFTASVIPFHTMSIGR